MSAIEYPTLVVRAPSGRRLETIALAIGICLPVPLLAVTGLSVPLPNVVERIAAALVPWADPVAAETVAARGMIVTTAGEEPPAGVAPAAVQQTLPTPTTRAGKRAAVAGGATAPVVRAPESRPTTSAQQATPTTSAAPTATPASVPVEVERTGTEPTAAGGDAPAPTTPRAETQPTSAPAPVSSVPARPAPAPTEPAPSPTQSTPVVTLPVLPVQVPPQVPATVNEVVDEVTTIVNDPVGTVVADPLGTVGGIVNTPLLPLPPLLPGLGKKK